MKRRTTLSAAVHSTPEKSLVLTQPNLQATVMYRSGVVGRRQRQTDAWTITFPIQRIGYIYEVCSSTALSFHLQHNLSIHSSRLSTLYPNRLLQILRTPASTMPNSGCNYYDPVEGECGRTCAQDSNYCNSRKRMNSQAMDFTDKPSIR
jgi:hypothetical protein